MDWSHKKAQVKKKHCSLTILCSYGHLSTVWLYVAGTCFEDDDVWWCEHINSALSHVMWERSQVGAGNLNAGLLSGSRWVKSWATNLCCAFRYLSVQKKDHCYSSKLLLPENTNSMFLFFFFPKSYFCTRLYWVRKADHSFSNEKTVTGFLQHFRFI